MGDGEVGQALGLSQKSHVICGQRFGKRIQLSFSLYFYLKTLDLSFPV